MKGSAHRPKTVGPQCVYCSSQLDLATVADDTFAFDYPAYVCPSCGNVTLSLDQLDTYNSLRDKARGTSQRRTVKRIGNSLGLTFPASLRTYLQAGTEVEIEVLDPKTIQLKVVPSTSHEPTRRRAKTAA